MWVTPKPQPFSSLKNDEMAWNRIGMAVQVAHYEVRSKSLQTNKWNRMLMRVILACEASHQIHQVLMPRVVVPVAAGERSGSVKGGLGFAAECAESHRWRGWDGMGWDEGCRVPQHASRCWR